MTIEPADTAAPGMGTSHPIRRTGRSLRAPASLLVLMAFATLAVACGSVSQPQGWAPPVTAKGNLYVSIKAGKLAALNPNLSPETGAQCDNSVDDDGDGSINEGCPQAGTKSEKGSECSNDTNDDKNDGVADDAKVNDGCPAVVTRWVFPPDTDEGKKLDLEGIYGAPVDGGDTVYFGAHDGNVYAVNAADGALRWKFGTGAAILGAPALSKDNVLYVGSTNGKLYALTPKDGSEIHRFDTGSSIWTAPLVADGTVYVAAMNGHVYALDSKSLQPKWARDGVEIGGAGLLVDPALPNPNTLLVGGIDNTLFALATATGNQKWLFKADNWFWGRPLVAKDVVYLPNLDGNLYALNLSDGTPVWEKPFPALAPIRSSPITAGNGGLVVVDKDGDAYGVDIAKGTLQWGPVLLGKSVLSDPILLGDEVLIVAQGGDICRIDPKDGSPTTAKLCAGVPQ